MMEYNREDQLETKNELIVSDQKPDQAIKKAEQQKRRLSWMTPILSGIIGGSLVLGVTTYQHNKDETANASVQTQTNETTNSAASSNHANTEKLSSTNSSDISTMVENVSPAIVGISNYQKQTENGMFGFESNSSSSSNEEETGTGSGVIYKKANGKAYIITNNHVVEGASKLTVSLSNGKEVEGKLLGSDSLTDLAVVEISADHVEKVASFGDSSSLKAGESVIAIGNPLGKDLSRTVTQGIISGVDRTVSVDTSAGQTEMNVIQTDAAINPGNSGGALLNTKGEVIGINSMKISESGVEGIGFAIPSNDVKPIAEELMSKGKIERPYIGIGMMDLEQVPENYQTGTLGLSGSQLNKGVYIRQVASGSPAEKAGLKENDVIVSFNGKETDTGSALRNLLYNDAKVGDTVKVTLIRNGKTITKQITLDQKESASS
ncbi:trypsin-like peptidase domain-containing protein [Bacillus haynesii]|nr:trypsin-like peptidase domain-containing protein [Bacillus haynesii]UIN47469.1 trypsin-like peptidase domain-containing protein [Bacillus licheniformis]MCY8572071.1 trypsin-like peptidase domain-containing protein [Bacillus haynesii]MCY8593691.1 trypsin-like peptidase domain-containing protein [Bacillus haynesii]MCY8614089.1 trypsin-like peptidase domain-containing protein [Bacillus haynesii]WIY57811.1 trypsin-like peptidase domain-containing protein [Bacillus licheniformis]